MIPKHPAHSASRRRWILAYPLFVLAMLVWLGRNGVPWLEVGLVSGLFLVMLISEFVLMPRMSLPPSRWCSKCDARSRASSQACVGCGREFSADKPVLYPVDPSLLPASKRAGRLATGVAAAITVLVLGFWIFFPRFGGQAVGMTAYFCMIIYGFEFSKWMFLVRIARQVEGHSGAVCTHCVYPIDETMTVCPECGARETAKAARRDWLTTGLWLPRERVLLREGAATEPPSS